MANVDSTSNRSALEEAFRFIQKGNDQSEARDYWMAAENYSQAQRMLQRLCLEAPLQVSNNEEKTKIAALYRQQSADYLRRARDSLVSALKQETADDQKMMGIGTNRQDSTSSGDAVSQSTLLTTLSDQECVHRMKIFGRLFAIEPEDPKTTLEQQSSLEARLQELNDSLPSAFKSEKERMRDLNRGLARLGLSLYPNSPEQQEQPHVFGIADSMPKTDSEQLDWIIAQAKDEVADVTSDVLLDDDDEDELSLDDEDANLTAEVCKDMHNKLVAAQVSLSKLIALFEVDQGNDAEIQFNQSRGKKVLKDTRLLLRQVTEKWNVC